MNKFFLLLFLFLVSFACLSQITGKVVGISDGDTFTFLTNDKKQIKVRLYGVDCPEKGQPFGNEAKLYLSNLIFGKEVSIVEIKKDKFGRTVALVTFNKKSINEQLIEGGMAWHFTKYDRNLYWASLEMKARKAKTGLWKDPHPVAPWEWRKIKKKHN